MTHDLRATPKLTFLCDNPIYGVLFFEISELKVYDGRALKTDHPNSTSWIWNRSHRVFTLLPWFNRVTRLTRFAVSSASSCWTVAGILIDSINAFSSILTRIRGAFVDVWNRGSALTKWPLPGITALNRMQGIPYFFHSGCPYVQERMCRCSRSPNLCSFHHSGMGLKRIRRCLKEKGAINMFLKRLLSAKILWFCCRKPWVMTRTAAKMRQTVWSNDIDRKDVRSLLYCFVLLSGWL